ncbi:MAG: 16S rRNA (cytosine(967)-C(5))-methyltransferase RsmB [Clostridiales bacterium]|nr:16S rRNA (cytosine(967)-C(5))-methyltransferase RsmB [Clostridiales bacterium]
MNIRELILDMLLEIEKENTYSHILMRSVLDKYDYLSAKEKAFIKRVTEGTLERRMQIDYIIDSYSKIPVKKMKPLIRNLLRMSVYQILFMDGVPDSAICNEAVKLAGKRKFQSLKGFINGVLRNIARQKDQIAYPDRDKNPGGYLSVRYSMPEYLISMWMEDYGEKQTEKMLQAMLAVRPVTIRLKETMSEEEQEELLRKIKAAGIRIKKHAALPYAYDLEHLDGVRSIPGFEEGLLTVQDVSSMLCVEEAGIKEGDFVIDVCAAPGGKATHAAVKLKGRGKVLARDLTEEKTALIKENAVRQKLTNIIIEAYDATVYDKKLREKADVVLADLPCSGLGIVGKKRDIKYNITKEALQELPLLQKEILNTIWQYVKPGGVLIYSTCTIHKEENEKMAAWFADNYPFELTDMRQLLPGVHETDGFFIARFRRHV